MEKFKVLSTELDFSFLKAEIIPFECIIYSVSTAQVPQNNSLLFCNELNDEVYGNLRHIFNSIIILNKKDCDYIFSNNFVIYSERPRKTYAELLNQILLKSISNSNVESVFKDGYFCHSDTKLGDKTIVEPFVYIGKNVNIGNNCQIRTGAKILNNVTIGNNCIIKENSVLGSDGFGVERDEDGTTYKIPHLGGVVIGDYVEIGAVSVIAQGTIYPTQISDFVKIDDHVFIAHNVRIGKGSVIIANSEVSGSVVIGEMSWIAPNACIRDGLTIGDNAVVGMGAVVVKNVSNNSKVFGNPAKEK